MDTAILRKHPLFSFGTLQDADVFDLVTGGLSFERSPRRTAWLPDHRVVNAIDGPHPVLQPASGEWAPGLLFHDLPESVLERIAWFEWPEFRAERKTVVCEDARRTSVCFMPDQTWPASQTPWSLEAWRREQKTELLAYAELMMDFLGACTAEELDVYWEPLLARAKGYPAELPEHMEVRCREIREEPGRHLRAFLRQTAQAPENSRSAVS